MGFLGAQHKALGKYAKGLLWCLTPATEIMG